MRLRGKIINLLFTSVGRRVELMRSFRAAEKDLGVVGRIIATDVDPLAPASHVVDQLYLVPPATDPSYVSLLIEICKREHITATFPLIDLDIPVLARNRVAIESTGTRLAVIPEAAVPIADDKLETLRFFTRIGLSVPMSWLPEEIDPAEARYPLFIKPRHGSASENTFKVRNARELRFFSERVPEPIIQELLLGPEITADVVCDLQGNLMAITLRRRIAVRAGEVAKGVTVYDSRIIEGCERIARELPAVGPVTVQCMMKDGVPHFTEINARFGGGIPLAIAAGADVPRWLLARLANIPQQIPPIGTYRTGLYMTRFDDSFFLTEADLEHTGRRRL